MPAITGVSVLFKVKIAAVYTVVAGQRDATLNLEEPDEADFTAKDTGGWFVGATTIRRWSIDFNALFIEGNAAWDALIAAWMSGALVDVQVALPGGDTYSGQAKLSLSLSAPYLSEAEVSGTARGMGALVLAP